MIFVPIWIAFGYLYASSYTTPSPLSTELLGQPHSLYGQRALVMRTLLSLCFFTLSAGGQFKLLSLLFLMIATTMAYDALVLTPYYFPYMNVYLAAANGSFFYGAMALVIHVHGPAKWHSRDTVALFAGAPLFGTAFGLLKLYLMRFDQRIANRFFKEATEALSRDPHMGSNVLATSIEFHYHSPLQVEVCSRILRQSPPGELSQAMKITAETILLTGLRQFPESTMLNVFMGNYKMFVTHDVQSSTSSAERAKTLATGLVEVAMSFWLDLEVLSKTVSDGGGGENTMDLAQYVEFQNTFSALLKVHRSAYRGERRFWRLCAQSNVAFNALSGALDLITANELKTDRAYKIAMEKYPKNVTLLRSYGRFLEELKNDPYTAQKYYAEAEKIEESNAADAGDEENGQVNDKRDAVIVIRCARCDRAHSCDGRGGGRAAACPEGRSFV